MIRRLQRFCSIVAVLAACSGNDSTSPTTDPPPNNMVRAEITGVGSGAGRITSTPAGLDCALSAGALSGTCNTLMARSSVISLSAAASQGSIFQGWTGPCSGVGSCSLTLSQDVSTAASFAKSCSFSTITAVVNVGQTVNGTLSNGDCALDDGSYADLYQLTVPNSSIQLKLESTAFDAYMIVFKADGTVLAEDDDTGGSHNALISATVPAGTYVVAANSAASRVFGAYQLSISNITNGGGGGSGSAVQSVAVAPASSSIALGSSVQLTATARDAAGSAISGKTFSWSTSNASVATVNGAGLVTATGAGTANVTATTDGKSGTAQVTVVAPVTVQSITISPASGSIQVGSSVQFSATARDGNGNAISGKAFAWSSSNVSVAPVNSNGLVTGAGPGTATVTATVDGKSASVGVTVTSPAPSATNIVVTNQLIFPINVAVNGSVVGSVSAQSTQQVRVTASAIVVSWELVRPAVSGRAIGDPMAGVFPQVSNPPGTLNYTVNNVVGSQPYFAPLISNSGAQNWLMGVNVGLQSENLCNCVVGAGSTNVAIGYYRFFSNSNVRAYLASNGYAGQYLFWANMSITTGSGTVQLR